MRVLFVLILLLSVRLLSGQNVQTTFHLHNGDEVKSMDQSTFYRNMYFDTIINNTNIFRLEEYYTATNSPRKSAYIIGDIQPFKYFFEKYEFYPNGVVSSIEKYNISGYNIDTAFYFYPNNTLKMVTFRNTTRENLVSDKSLEYVAFFDSLQNPLLVHGNGFVRLDIQHAYAPEGSYEEGNMVNSTKEGRWIGYWGEYVYEEDYVDGLLQQGKATWPNGKEVIYNAATLHTAPQASDVVDFIHYIQQNFRYPAEARKNKVKGRMTVAFTVATNGAITNLQVTKDLGYGTKEAVEKLIRGLTILSPAIYRGIPVPMRYTVPIELRP